MSEPVKRRAYNSSARRAAAHGRRAAALETARQLFLSRGYAATTMADIAAEAGVAVDTLYATIGTKPQLFALLLETALSGTDQAVPIENRDYVAVIRAEPDARRKLALYAASTTRIWRRMAPLLEALQRGAAAEPELATIWDAFVRRRADNLRLLMADLDAVAALPSHLDRKVSADGVWAISSTEVYLLLTGKRGWPPEQYEAWLAETLAGLLLPPCAAR